MDPRLRGDDVPGLPSRRLRSEARGTPASSLTSYLSRMVPGRTRGARLGRCWQPEGVEARLGGHQGPAGPLRGESLMRPLPLRRRQPRESEDGGAGRPAALARTRGKTPWITKARRPGRGRCVARGRSADRLARLAGLGHAGLGSAPQHDRASGPAPLNRRWRCLHLETWCLHVDTTEVSRSRHQVSTYRHQCLY